MNNDIENIIKSDIKSLICDAIIYPFSHWEFCQALRHLIEKWEEQLDEEMFNEAEEFSNILKKEVENE